MNTPTISIPYEKQTDLQTNRACGAACLAMVYRSLGKEVPQAEIWPLIAKKNRFGSVSSTTHLMALHALSQGFSAVAIQARYPLHVLRICRDTGIRAIVNQRPRPDVATGHYTVLVDIDDKTVVVHDPSLGPLRRISHAELMELWQPSSADSEIVGNVLIGIAAGPAPLPECKFCHTAFPPATDCPKCGKPVGLSPAPLLGCIRDGCIARMWNYVACPACDFLFNETGKAAAQAAPADASNEKAPLPAPSDLDKAFAQLDRFCSHVLSIPGLADHAGLKAQLDFIQAGKEKVRLTQAEEFAAIKARLDRMAADGEESKKKADERRKKQEELDAPLPPLDAKVLGQALLKNLGFK